MSPTAYLAGMAQRGTHYTKNFPGTETYSCQRPPETPREEGSRACLAPPCGPTFLLHHLQQIGIAQLCQLVESTGASGPL